MHPCPCPLPLTQSRCLAASGFSHIKLRTGYLSFLLALLSCNVHRLVYTKHILQVHTWEHVYACLHTGTFTHTPTYKLVPKMVLTPTVKSLHLPLVC